MISKFWNSENRSKILEALSQGAPIATAAKFAGVPPKTFRGWLIRGESIDEMSSDSEDLELYEFWKECVQSIAVVQLECTRSLRSGSRTGVDWRSAESYLSRVNPEEWSSKQQIEFQGEFSVTDIKGAQRLIAEQFGSIGKQEPKAGS